MYTSGYKGWAGGKAGFHPALLSSALHGGALRFAAIAAAEQETAEISLLPSIGEYAADGTVALAVPPRSLFSLCRQSQVHFSFLPSLLLWGFPPFSVLRSLHHRAPGPLAASIACWAAPRPPRAAPRLLRTNSCSRRLDGGKALRLHANLVPSVPSYAQFN